MYEKLDSIEEQNAIIAAIDASFGIKSDNQSGKKLSPRFDDLKSPETILNHINELKSDVKQKSDRKGLFTVKSGKEWLEEAKHTPTPRMLFSEFWFENELCILFADTNLGKSILAVQIADSISRGEAIEGFRLGTAKQEVMYFDFELSKKQFEVRYATDVGGGNLVSHYDFDDKFKRVEIDPDADIPDNIPFEDYLIQSLEFEIVKSETKVVIIDNITFLKSETERAKDAVPLVKRLKELKRKFNLSMMLLAHTPKRDLSKPLTKNDLGGSKHLMNFVDSSFAIGENPHERGLRYIKQIKARNTEMKYDTNNVMTCEIVKPSNFLKFEFVNYDSENSHLKKKVAIDWDIRKDELLEFIESGTPNTKIAKHYGVSEGAVRKWKKKIEEDDPSDDSSPHSDIGNIDDYF